MYRQSSKGNPWHDAKGRFTSAEGKATRVIHRNELGEPIVDKKGNVEHHFEDAPPVMWANRGEIYKDLPTDEKGEVLVGEELRTYDARLEAKKPNGNRDFYYAQSGERHKKAVAISLMDTSNAAFEGKKVYKHPNKEEYSLHRHKGWVEVPKKKNKDGSESYPRAIKQEVLMNEFRIETQAAHRNDGGAKNVPFLSGPKTRCQAVQSPRITDDVMVGKEALYRNTNTTMKLFDGCTVESYTGNAYFASCPRNASKAEVQQRVDKYCSEYKEILSQPNTILKIWRGGDGQVRMCPVTYFNSQKEADAFAKTQPDATITDHRPEWKRKQVAKKSTVGKKSRKVDSPNATKQDNAFSEQNANTKALERRKERRASKKKKA